MSKNTAQMLGTIVILMVWVVLVGPRVDALYGPGLLLSMAAVIVAIVVWRIVAGTLFHYASLR